MRRAPHAQPIEITHNEKWPDSFRIRPPFISIKALFSQIAFDLSRRLQRTAISDWRVAGSLPLSLPFSFPYPYRYRLSQYDTFTRNVFAGCRLNRSRTSPRNA